MKAIYLTIIVLILMISGCDIFGPETVEQKYLFDRYYVNNAWGFVLNGYYIDIKGDVYSYSVTSAGKVDPDTLRMIRSQGANPKEEELDLKYHFNKKFLKNIDPRVVRRKLEEVYLVPLKAYSDTTFKGADMGAYVHSCYRYNTQNNTYREVVLKVDGDVSYYNTSETAADLVKWMETELEDPKSSIERQKTNQKYFNH